ncbi:hypothetical protein MBLNU459_g7932t1 [Dothideomycetes sp. NU459]
MSNSNQPYSPTNDVNASQAFGGNGLNGNARPATSGSAVPVPHTRTPSAPFPAMQREFGGMAGFQGARSPPKAKNTSHVPCKFYPYGTCQAGAACQFSHDLDPMTQNAPCKYFAKGSCKFGQGCALAHILPDGRVINRPPRGQQFAYGRRSQMAQAMPAGPPSLLSMQANDLSSPQEFPYLAQQPDDPLNARYAQGPPLGIPTIDAGIPAEHMSNYGSPPNDNRLGASPSNRGLNVLDAPLPSSFDSQGISHAARHGPFASSVPPRFGIESPPSSLPNKAFLGSTALRGLQGTAFGDAANLDGVLHGAGSSPPTFDEPMSFSKRPLHSERLARPKATMSASLGTRPSPFYSHYPNDTSEDSDDGSEEDGIGEDLLPSSLHELLPQDKLRRFSRNTTEEDGNNSFLSAQRRAISFGTAPQDSKVGSLSPHSASPSRYNSIWSSRSYQKNETENNGPSAFGHVGSPLRPSALRSSSLNISSSAGDASPYGIGSPPKQASMSMLTQELQRSNLSDPSKPAQPPLHSPGIPRSLSNGTSAGRAGLIERGISSTSLGRETIEEEQGLFSMEEEESELGSSVPNLPSSLPRSGFPGSMGSRKPNDTSLYGLAQGKTEGTLGPIGGQRSTK